MKTQPHDVHSVAIIGMSGRFPGAANPDQFWRNLCAGVEALSVFSEQELQAAGVPPAFYNHPRYVKAGTVLEGTDLFDAGFFGVSPREAEIIDPQHRLFLECAWEAMENAGYAPQHYPGSIGVYAGVSMNTYNSNVIARNPEVMASAGSYQLMLGNDKDFLPTRVSYKLNLRGPSMAIQTACSTSLVAVQVAYHSLLKHQCDMALAGGASVLFPQKTGYLYQEGMIFSPDGHCRPFDAQGRGLRGGSGVGVVLLKRLTDALADGDPIRAVIRGAAINNDGSSKVGYTAPSVEGQAEVIAMAQALAGVEPETITYVEAHGTGTPLGDPIEMAALAQVFSASTEKKRFCAVGSLKSNIGHLDAAAGVAGLIKTVLSLEHKAIPPSLNYTTPNPGIDFESGPFFVNTQLSEWPAGDTPRRAGVSSFGIGGTNAHLVLEEAPVPEPSAPSDDYQILTLSAKTPTALEAVTAHLVEHLETHQDVSLADVAYTLQQGREPFRHRRIVVCRDRHDAVQALTTADAQGVLTAESDLRARPVVFMLSGQGSQYVNMGRALYQRQPEFRKHLDHCAALFLPILGRDLRDVLYPPDAPDHTTGTAAMDSATAALRETGLAQPALLAIEYALATMWMNWGVQPEAMIGHSIGEYVAACLAGVFTLEDAVALVATRGRLMQALPAGTMLSVPLSEDDVVAFLNGRGSLAAINAPGLCTISGPPDAMGEMETALARRGVECRRLHTSHAFHSAMVDPVLEPFRESFRAVALHPPKIPFLSNLTGTWITDAEATDPDYWVRHLRHTVRFASGLDELRRDQDRLFLEVGPGNTLGTFARQVLNGNARAQVFSSLPHPRDPEPADRFAATTLGRLWLQGAPVDWSAVHEGARRRRVALPTYPFERERYWVDPTAPVAPAGSPSLGKQPDLADWFYVPSWKLSAALDATDHTTSPAHGNWLVFADEHGLGSALVARLVAGGRTVTTVCIGEDFRELAPGCYSLAPSNREHYRLLFHELQAAGRLPTWLVHLWNVTRVETGGDALGALETTQARGFYSLLSLAQAVGQQGATAPMHLTVVSNGVQGVLRDAEVIHPEKATLLGPCMVIPEEYPNLTCRSVDIELAERGSPEERALIDRLLREAALGRSSGCVAYRAGRRWERTYDSVRLERASPGTFTARKGGTYLITGGTGGLGLAFARHLAQTENPVLILTARSTLPPRDQWGAWVAGHDPQDRVGTIIREIEGLEALGARVLVVAADVADEGRMRAVIAEILGRFTTIHGVIHAAGVPGDGIVQLKTPALATPVLDPKVKGTLVLESLLRDIPLDFFVLCSSISAIHAGPGAADYSAANAFLDAFAHAQAGRGRSPMVSINWDAWQEVGMAVHTQVPPDMREARAQSLRHGILPAEGVDALARIIGAGFPQVIASTRDLPLILDLLRLARPSSRTSEGPSRSPVAPQPGRLENSARHPRPALANRYVAPRDEEEKEIALIWSTLLGIEEIGVHDNFFDLGGHSLMATRVLARLQDSVGVALPLETVLDAPTVAQMAERIATLRLVADAGRLDGDQQADREEFEL